jgi:hypothetical protein
VQAPRQRDVQAISQEGNEDVGLDARLELVKDRSDGQIAPAFAGAGLYGALRVKRFFDAGSGLNYNCRCPVKQRRALLGSSLPRNSRVETHSDGPGADRNQPVFGLGGCRGQYLSTSSEQIS